MYVACVLLKFKSPQELAKHPVGRPRKQWPSASPLSSTVSVAIRPPDKQASPAQTVEFPIRFTFELDCTSGDTTTRRKALPTQTVEFEERTEDELKETAVCKDKLLVKICRGHYHLYTLTYKRMFLQQLPTMTAEVLSKKYNVPTTTILSWEKQLKTKDRKVSGKC